jgi:DNA-directed RNA polymerase beta subunit
VYSGNEPATVDRVIETTNKDGVRVVTLVTRTTRSPAMGDKFSSRHGQKGVCGMMYRSEDMPWVCGGKNAGVKPMIIVNPHGFPSRMTLGQPMEGIAAKAGCEMGKMMNGTAHNGDTMEEYSRILAAQGLKPNGKETMVDPFTGEMIEADIYLVPTFYEALKHIAIDKIHARGTGPVQCLCRQPTEGKGKSGGMRLGEMERDALIAHGASHVMIDRLFLHSDPNKTYICSRCGMMGTQPSADGSTPAHCNLCETDEGVLPIGMPKAMELMDQELLSATVALRMEITPPDPDGFSIF